MKLDHFSLFLQFLKVLLKIAKGRNLDNLLRSKVRLGRFKIQVLIVDVSRVFFQINWKLLYKEAICMLRLAHLACCSLGTF